MSEITRSWPCFFIRPSRNEYGLRAGEAGCQVIYHFNGQVTINSICVTYSPRIPAISHFHRLEMATGLSSSENKFGESM